MTFSSTRQTGTFSQKPITHLFNYNVTGQITRNLRGRFAASNQRDNGGYALPGLGAERREHVATRRSFRRSSAATRPTTRIRACSTGS